MDKQLVLIVEDDRTIAAALERMARRAGFLTAVDCEGALAHVLARNLRPCCVLLDISLPGRDGRTVLAALKADPKTRDIPVVMSSGWEDQPTRLSCLAAGAEDYQTKPPSPMLFERLARRFIEGRAETELSRYLVRPAEAADDDVLGAAVRGFADTAKLN